ncbi:hypothetical protein [Pyxidicoccus trucidator]|uniref:hypothetical protein n=1 Tax=Pyxidicoccus trucidator TaxID=2709662 RepID=UPI0013DCF570|nr:hypothetical protein [Pyxidicoccus trucidator]
MAVLLLGLVGCASTQHSAPPAKHPGTVGTTRNDLVNSTLRCKSSQGSTISVQSILELDDTPLKPKGETGCVAPGGTVRFASKCTHGPVVYIVKTDGAFFSSAQKPHCGPEHASHDSWVTFSEKTKTYAIILRAKDDYCDLPIASQAGSKTTDYSMFSACSLPRVPKEGDAIEEVLTGKLEVATTVGGDPPAVR